MRSRYSRSSYRKWFLFVGALFFIMVALAAACRRQERAKTPTGKAPSVTAVPVQARGEVVASAPSSSPPSSGASPRATLPPIIELAPCLLGCPISERSVNGRLLEREGWVLFNNPRTKFADWVAYRVSPSTIGRSKSREWRADPKLPPDETLEPEDFRGAHAALDVDRGHQAPLASFSGTRNTEPLNYMSNVTPQRSTLNQKLWNELEQAERGFVLTEQAPLFVVTGPLYEREMPPLPGADELHTVPSGYFKLIAFAKGDDIETAAVIVDQETPPRESYCHNQVTIDEVERRAGLDIFPLLPDAQEIDLERRAGRLFEELGCEPQR